MQASYTSILCKRPVQVSCASILYKHPVQASWSLVLYFTSGGWRVASDRGHLFLTTTEYGRLYRLHDPDPPEDLGDSLIIYLV